jgi:hypothetical protein
MENDGALAVAVTKLNPLFSAYYRLAAGSNCSRWNLKGSSVAHREAGHGYTNLT